MAAALWLGQASGAEAILHARILDGTTGDPTACTVTINDAHGKVITEIASFRQGFRCAGEFTRHLPPGPTRIRITRGFETKVLEQEVNLAEGETKNLAVTLHRVVDLRTRGWYAGDSHVHMLHGERTVPVTFDFVALTAKAEDLQYLSLAQAWALDNPTPERLEAELKKRSTPDCVLAWNLEAPKNYYKGDAGRCLGHCWNVGLHGRTPEGRDVVRMLLDASAWDYESDKPTYANFESQQLIHDQGGVACYSHPARWWMGSWGGQGGYPKVDRMRVSNMAVELPLDTLLGPTYDGIDIITGPGEFEANAKAFAIWSLLLNHGYRIAATGSSDSCFDRPGGGVPGTPRLYTFLAGKFSVAKAARAIAQGRTVVTTGPLLVATLDGEPPGAAFAAGPKPRVLSFEAWSSGASAEGLLKMEVLRNGQPWREWTWAGKPDHVQTNVTLLERETAWYCVRVSGAERRTAVSSAFYFADKSYRRPEPVRARVHALVLDAQTGKPIPADLRELTFSGTVARAGKRHRLAEGEARISIPGSARLRAEAKGYAPVILSPFLDSPGLVKTIITLNDDDLANWQTYARLREQLENVELVFRLPKTE